ncbi:uncharacterized protein LOC128220793 [Mya arenaria]|uniref:uncharacterized protein LOC128220793 n=1 Tax=Mya arenaria TaxID=6604 RepID=UPI0022E018EC|nr:uncharacterized protein LOC128220793 [Mya arenaria]
METSRLEELRDSFKDAQTVKSNLERLLNEQRQARRTLETAAEEASNKHKNVIAVHTKISESLKISKHKTNQSQAYLDSLEATVKDKKNLLQKIDRQISDENDNMVKDMRSFEDALSQLTKALIAAKQQYSEANLQKTIEERLEEFNKLQKQSQTVSKELEAAASYSRSLEGREVGPEGDGLDRQAVWTLMNKDLDSTRAEVAKLSEQLQNLN